MVNTSHKHANFGDGGCYRFANIDLSFIKSKFWIQAAGTLFNPGFSELCTSKITIEDGCARKQKLLMPWIQDGDFTEDQGSLLCAFCIGPLDNRSCPSLWRHCWSLDVLWAWLFDLARSPLRLQGQNQPLLRCFRRFEVVLISIFYLGSENSYLDPYIYIIYIQNILWIDPAIFSNGSGRGSIHSSLLWHLERAATWRVRTIRGNGSNNNGYQA